jgi:CO/xanthine dehydrogenase Mo-binding subunit
MEMQMSKLAAALGMDPAELRRINVLRDGSLLSTGDVLHGGTGLEACLQTAVAAAQRNGLRWGQKRQAGDKVYGVGIACGMKNVGYNLGMDDHSEAVVEATPERAVVKTGASEVGQGVTTLLAQLAASQLELPLEAVQVVSSDTDLVPDAGSSSASRHTFVTGNAVLRAAAEAARCLAALGPQPPAEALPVIGRAVYHVPTTFPLHPETGQTQRANPTYGYGAQVVEVEVDLKSGQVRVLQALVANDAGQAINLTSVEGQIEGGFVMGQGYSLLEEYILQDGRPLSTEFSTFLIPTVLDVPGKLESLVVEVPDPDGPYGAKGIGEMTMLPTPGAIAAAIYDATGVWVEALPATPERLLRALGKL